MTEIIIMSLGGSPAPLSKSIETHKPVRIIFLASHDSVTLAGEVLKSLTFRPEAEFEITENPNLLFECYRSARRCVDRLEKWNVSPEQVIVDYTGGTKVMTAALILATVGYHFRFNYVGGEKRDKDGVGIVLNGHEALFSEMSPWSIFAEEERRQVVTLFNRRRYSAVIEIINLCTYRELPLQIHDYFRFIHPLAEGFLHWDQFMHNKAIGFLQTAVTEITNYLSRYPDEKIRNFFLAVQERKVFLKQVLTQTESLSKKDLILIIDLLNNARRRMADRRYDDAAARIYRALELFGQICFEEKTGISNNKVPEDMIPEAIRGEYIRKYKDPETEKLKLPLEATFKCLEALGDESGRRFVERHKEIKNIQRNRNLSILAHGINPVTEKAVKSIFEIVADFTGMKNSDYFDFPMLP